MGLRGWFGDAFRIMFPDELSETVFDVLEANFFKKELHMHRVLNKVSQKLGEDMKDFEARSALQTLGVFLLDISKLKSTVVRPNNGDELQSLAEQVLLACISKKPISLFTPFCPDWSRDSQGRYDLKSLGGGISFIGEKFFSEVPAFLRIFARHNVPYIGTLVFADWGLETEIDAKDTYGRKLSAKDIQMSFASTFAQTDERLLALQRGKEGFLLKPYRVVKMTDFFDSQGVDALATCREMEHFFKINQRGKRIAEYLHTVSMGINRERLKLTEEQNRKQAIQNLSEYATLGQAFGENGIIIAAESPTATRAYNLPRRNKLPVFYLKGSTRLDEGVNIL